MNKQKPLIAILLGDPSGIGPELISKFLKNKSINADVVIIGEKKIADKGDQIAKIKNNYNLIDDIKRFKSNSNEINFIDISEGNNRNYVLGKYSANSGASVLESLKYSLDLGKKNLVDGIMFAPFNKASMQMAGSKYEDELHLMADKLSLKNFYCELNFLRNVVEPNFSSLYFFLFIKKITNGIIGINHTNKGKELIKVIQLH